MQLLKEIVKIISNYWSNIKLNLWRRKRKTVCLSHPLRITKDMDKYRRVNYLCRIDKIWSWSPKSPWCKGSSKHILVAFLEAADPTAYNIYKKAPTVIFPSWKGQIFLDDVKQPSKRLLFINLFNFSRVDIKEILLTSDATMTHLKQQNSWTYKPMSKKQDPAIQFIKKKKNRAWSVTTNSTK